MSRGAPDRRRIRGTPTPQAELVSRVIGDHFARFGGHLSQPPAHKWVEAASWPLSNFWANSPFVLPKNEILAESEFAAPTITKLIPILFSTSGASVAYNVNPVADQFQRAFQTSTFCNRLYSFFNKRWFFDQVLNDFLVRSFLRFGYEVSFEALDKGAIEILGPYGISYTFRRLAERISQLQSGFVVRRVRYDPWPPAWSGGGGSSVVGKRETRLYEPEERLQSSSRGVQTGAFCSASRNASEWIPSPSEWSAYAPLD